MISRRALLTAGAATAGAGLVGLGVFLPRGSGTQAVAETKGAFPFVLTDAEWRERLDPAQYYVLRQAGTERAFTSPLDQEERDGVFHCAGCDTALYSSDHKFDSRTGWPSFWQEIEEGAVGTSVDFKLIYPRTEVHCANCGGHLGHIFNDGPPPTGKRHCINGVAMVFKPETAAG